MRVFAYPATDVIWQIVGDLARTGSRQLGSRDSCAGGIELKVTRLGESVIQRGHDHNPGVDRRLN